MHHLRALPHIALSLIALLALAACDTTNENTTTAPPEASPVPVTQARAAGQDTAATWGRLASPHYAGGRVHATLERSHGPWGDDVDFPIATLDAQGGLHLIDAPPPLELSDTVQSIFADCDSVHVENGDALASQVTLIVTRADGTDAAGLHAVTSERMGGWLQGSSEPPEPGDAHFILIYATQAARLHGHCDFGPGLRGDYDITLTPGWNLRRTTMLAFSEPDEYGDVTVLRTRTDVVRQFPSEAFWQVTEHTH